MASPTFFESIRLDDGRLPLLPFHQDRVDSARRKYYAKSPAFRLNAIVEDLELPAEGLHKVRLHYAAGLIDHRIEAYEMRPIRSLRVVHADDLRYHRKFNDRRALDALYDKRASCDDVLIVQRGYLTDTSYANIALYDGNKWYTPAWPLLKGTRRAYLLQQGTITPSVIRLRDLGHFTHLRMFNAMVDWERAPTVRTTAVLRH